MINMSVINEMEVYLAENNVPKFFANQMIRDAMKSLRTIPEKNIAWKADIFFKQYINVSLSLFKNTRERLEKRIQIKRSFQTSFEYK